MDRALGLIFAAMMRAGAYAGHPRGTEKFANIDNGSVQINISNYVAGMYVLHVFEGNAEVKALKFVKE